MTAARIVCMLLLGCTAPADEPVRCVAIPCTAALSDGGDHWASCTPQDALCQLPTKPAVECRITPADASKCLCRTNPDETVTALCVGGL